MAAYSLASLHAAGVRGFVRSVHTGVRQSYDTSVERPGVRRDGATEAREALLQLEASMACREPPGPIRPDLTLAVVDLRKAFDTVPVAEVWRQMAELQFDRPLGRFARRSAAGSGSLAVVRAQWSFPTIASAICRVAVCTGSTKPV